MSKLEPSIGAAGGDPDPASVRDRVLAAAVELFADQGYDGTSVAQVVAAAGVAKGGFYHHFASKEALLYEVYGDLISRQLEGLQRILAQGGTPEQTLRSLVHDLVTTTAASARPALVFWREMNKLGDDRAADHRRQRRRYHDAVRTLVAEAQRDGQFARVASADTVTVTIFGVVNELPLWFKPGGRTSAVQLADELADLVLAALVPGREPAAVQRPTASPSRKDS